MSSCGCAVTYVYRSNDYFSARVVVGCYKRLQSNCAFSCFWNVIFFFFRDRKESQNESISDQMVLAFSSISPPPVLLRAWQQLDLVFTSIPHFLWRSERSDSIFSRRWWPSDWSENKSVKTQNVDTRWRYQYIRAPKNDGSLYVSTAHIQSNGEGQMTKSGNNSIMATIFISPALRETGKLPNC